MVDILIGGLSLWLPFHETIVMSNYNLEKYLTKVEKFLDIIK